jgi:RNA polymerase sigma factor (sigma-70 family)
LIATAARESLGFALRRRNNRFSIIIRTILITSPAGQASQSLRTGSGVSLPPPRGPYVLERYHRELLNFLSRQVRDRDTAADLVQESFLRVLSAQSSGQAVLDMRALLYRVARNLVVDQHRRSEVRRHDDLDALPESQHPPASQHLQPEEFMASKQVIHAYVATIEALPERCREAFVLHVFDECSHAQIAQHMGISISMVEKHIVRAMVACKLCERRLRGEGWVKPGKPDLREEARPGVPG